MPKNVLVYDWFEIQEMICQEMQIDEEYFRDYHKLVGGGYKDLWHEALDSIIPDSMHNDSTVTVFALYDEDWYLKNKPEWTWEFYKAVVKVFDKIDPKQDGVEVNFSW